MKINELVLAQLEREAPVTRRTLERVPEGKNDWKPHPKSMSLGGLAALVAGMPSWLALIIDTNDLDLATIPPQPGVRTNRELLQIHDKAVEAARKALSSVKDDHLAKTWKLRMGDKILGERPRSVEIVEMIPHLAHHRGQLSVYLRLNDRPVPAIYGGSADEHG